MELISEVLPKRTTLGTGKSSTIFDIVVRPQLKLMTHLGPPKSELGRFVARWHLISSLAYPSLMKRTGSPWSEKPNGDFDCTFYSDVTTSGG